MPTAFPGTDRVTTPAQTTSPDALIVLASELSHELHPARRKGRYDLHSSLDHDLGLDSLSRAELLLRIERTLGRALPENAVVTVETLGDLWHEFERSPAGARSKSIARPEPRGANEEQLALPDDARSLVEVLQFHATHHAERVHITLDEGARWRIAHTAARLLFALTRTPVRVDGDRAVLERAGVLVANHASYVDAVALTAALPAPVRFVAKAELRGSRFLRIALDRLGVHYVARAEVATSLTDALRARQLATRGAPPLLFFPEGTFTRAPGLRAFHMGAFDTAAQARLPLVPLVIDGTRSILRDGSWLLRRGAIEVRVGPALQARESTFEGALELRDAARAWTLTHGSEPDLGQ